MKSGINFACHYKNQINERLLFIFRLFNFLFSSQDECIVKEIEIMGIGLSSNIDILSNETINTVSDQQIYDFWKSCINDRDFQKDTLISKIEAMLVHYDSTPEEFKQWKFKLEQIKEVGHGYQIKKVHYTARNGITNLDMGNTFYFIVDQCKTILKFDSDKYKDAKAEIKTTDSLKVLEYIRFVDGTN